MDVSVWRAVARRHRRRALRELRLALQRLEQLGHSHQPRGLLMSNQDFRIGLVGCGRISQFHIEAIGKVEGLTLAAVCDVDAARARATGEKVGVPSFGSLDAMLKGTE